MLDSTKLSKEILSKIMQKGFKQTKENEQFIQALSEAIVEHITLNAVVETKGSPTAQVGTIK